MKSTENYAELTIVEIEKAVADVENVEFLQELLQFETENKNRAGAIDALNNRIIELTSENNGGDTSEPETQGSTEENRRLYEETLLKQKEQYKKEIEGIIQAHKEELDKQKENYLAEIKKLKKPEPKENPEASVDKLSEAIVAKRRMEQKLRTLKAEVKSSLDNLLKKFD